MLVGQFLLAQVPDSTGGERVDAEGIVGCTRLRHGLVFADPNLRPDELRQVSEVLLDQVRQLLKLPQVDLPVREHREPRLPSALLRHGVELLAKLRHRDHTFGRLGSVVVGDEVQFG